MKVTVSRKAHFNAAHRLYVEDWSEEKNNKVLATGGRVLNFISLSEEFVNAKKNILNHINILDWQEGFFRKDIGYKVIDE